MSLLNTCVICDALLHDSGECVCERCKLPCPTCGNDVAKCWHPLTERLTVCLPDPLPRRHAA